MTVRPRWGAVAAAAGLLLAAAPAQAQVPAGGGWPPPMIFPWGNGSVFGNPLVQEPQLLGHLPNGTPVVNPWARQQIALGVPTAQSLFGQQYAMWNAAAVWNPAL